MLSHKKQQNRKASIKSTRRLHKYRIQNESGDRVFIETTDKNRSDSKVRVASQLNYVMEVGVYREVVQCI